MPACSQAWRSSSLIWREASEMAVPVAELLEAAASARGAHRHPDVGVLLLEHRRDRLGQRGDGARPVDDDVPGQSVSTAALFATAARGEYEGAAREDAHRYRTPILPQSHDDSFSVVSCAG